MRIEPTEFKRLTDGVQHSLSRDDAMMFCFAVEHALDCPGFAERYGAHIRDALAAAASRIIES